MPSPLESCVSIIVGLIIASAVAIYTQPERLTDGVVVQSYLRVTVSGQNFRSRLDKDHTLVTNESTIFINQLEGLVRECFGYTNCPLHASVVNYTRFEHLPPAINNSSSFINRYSGYIDTWSHGANMKWEHVGDGVLMFVLKYS